MGVLFFLEASLETKVIGYQFEINTWFVDDTFQVWIFKDCYHSEKKHIRVHKNSRMSFCLHDLETHQATMQGWVADI